MKATGWRTGNMCSVFMLALWCFLSSLVIVGAQTCEDPLNCILNKLVLHLPNRPYILPTYTEIVCTNISIYSLPSSYSVNQPSTLATAANNFSIDCTALMKGSRGTKVPIFVDVYDLFIVNNFTFSKSGMYATGLADSCDLISYKTQMTNNAQLQSDFAGSISNLCSKFQKLTLEKLLPQINSKLEAVVASQPSPVPEFGPEVLNWNNSIINKLHKILGLVTAEKIWPCITDTFPVTKNFTDTMIDFIIDKITNNTGVITIPVTPKSNSTFHILNLNVSMDLTGISVAGLDTFENVAVLEPSATSKALLSSTLGLGELALGINLTVTYDNGVSEPYEQLLHFDVALVNTTVDLDLVFAINETYMNGLFIDQLFESGCFNNAIEYLNISSLNITTDVSTIKVRQVTEAAPLEASIVELLDNAFELLTTDFKELITSVIRGIGQGQIRASINAGITDMVNNVRNNYTCPAHVEDDDDTKYIVWANSTLIKLVDDIVDVALGAEKMNTFLTCITGGTGALQLTLSNFMVSLSGLNSFYELDVLVPVVNNPYKLSSKLGLGYCTMSNCNPLVLSVSTLLPTSVSTTLDTLESSIMFAMDYFRESFGSPYSGYSALPTLKPGFSMDVSMSNFSLNTQTEMQLSTSTLNNLQIGQLGVTGCIASTFNMIHFDNIDASLSNATLVINDGSYERSIERAATFILDLLTSQRHIDKMNGNIASSLQEAGPTCANGGITPQSDDDGLTPQSSHKGWPWEMALLIGGCAISLAFLLYIYNYWGKTGQLSCMRIQDDQGNATYFGEIYNKYHFNQSLVFQSRIPLWVRIGFPLAVIGDIAMFIASNAEPDAVSVTAELVYGGKTYTPDPIFGFGLGNTIRDMWDAKVYPLAALIAFFSGAWPYIKLFFMLFAWIAPGKWLTIIGRESLLRVLDMLGKWSLIDFFVMVMMMCAFYFKLTLTSNFTVNVIVVPNWGFYSFLLATMISLGLGHIILAFHRLIVEPKISASKNAPTESLITHVYHYHTIVKDPIPELEEKLISSDSNDNNNNNNNNNQNKQTVLRRDLKPTKFAAIFVLCIIGAAVLVVILGTFTLTFNFEFKGLTGWLLRSQADVSYSLVKVGTSVPEASGSPDDFAVRWLEASFFAFGLAMPLMFFFALIVAWFMPMTLLRQRQMYVLAEVLNAWSALDVFVVSIVAALLEIQQFAAFIVGDSCDGINKLLEKYMDNILDGDDKCFDVIATLRSECWLIFLAALALLLVGWPSLSMYHVVIHDRLKSENQYIVLSDPMDLKTRATSTENILHQQSGFVDVSLSNSQRSSANGNMNKSFVNAEQGVNYNNNNNNNNNNNEKEHNHDDNNDEEFIKETCSKRCKDYLVQKLIDWGFLRIVQEKRFSICESKTKSNNTSNDRGHLSQSFINESILASRASMHDKRGEDELCVAVTLEGCCDNLYETNTNNNNNNNNNNINKVSEQEEYRSQTNSRDRW